MADPLRRNEIYSADLAPYVDLLVVVGGHDDGSPDGCSGLTQAQDRDEERR